MHDSILFDNKKVFFQDRGKGKVLVLLHGFTESLKIWTPFTDRLSKEFRVIAIDLPGHGKTGVFSESHSMEFMADTVDAVLSTLRVNSCVMIGHSMGGYVTLAYAYKYPQKIKGLGLFHSHAAADSEEAKINRENTIRLVEQNPKEFIRNFMPSLFAPKNITPYTDEIKSLEQEALILPPEGITAALKGMMTRADHCALIKNTDKPTLLIAGKEDSKIPLDILLNQAALAKHAEVLILADVGHMGFIEAKEQTLEFIRDFARRQLAE